MRAAALPFLSALPARSCSHVEQAMIRLLMLLGGMAAILFHVGQPLSVALAECECLMIVAGYLPGALLLLAWSHALKYKSAPDLSLHLRLSIALCADAFVVAAFTALSGHYAPYSLPVFMAIIVGYGWRFGPAYALAASAVCMLAFGLSSPLNPLFEPGSVATLGYYLCFIATPVYVLQVLHVPVHAPMRRLEPAFTAGAVSMQLPADAGPGALGARAPLIDDDMLAELREGCGGDATLWRKLVGQFEREAQHLLVEAGTAHDAGDPARCAFALHRLRGAAAAMAAPRLEQLAGAIESTPDAASLWREARETLDATVVLLDAAD